MINKLKGKRLIGVIALTVTLLLSMVCFFAFSSPKKTSAIGTSENITLSGNTVTISQQNHFNSINDYSYMNGNFSFSVDIERTDGVTNEDGTWNSGAIVIETMHPTDSWGVKYSIFAMKASDTMYLYILGDNGQDGVNFVVSEIRQGGTLTGTGALTHYDLAYYNKTLYILINSTTLYTIGFSELTNFSNGGAGWYNPLFDEGGVTYNKKIGLVALGAPSTFTITQGMQSISSLPSIFVNEDLMWTTVNGSSMNTATSSTLSAGAAKIFKNTATGEALSTSGNYLVKFTGVRSDGVSNTSGTWETGGLYIESGTDNYRVFFMREDLSGNIVNTVIYILRNNSVSYEYRISKEYSGTGASMTVEFAYKASEQKMYIIFNGSLIKIDNATKGYNSNSTLFSSSQVKKIGMFANVGMDFTNVSATTDENTVNTAISGYTNEIQIQANPIFFNPMFTDGAVLQRNKRVKIFGRGGDIGNTVKVTFNGQTKSGTITNSGWYVYLDAMSANATGQALTVAQYDSTGSQKQGNDVTVNNIVIGEVFLGNGQSNMQTEYSYYTTTGMAGSQTKNDYYTAQTGRVFATEYATYNNYDNIRILTEPYAKPTEPVVKNAVNAMWTQAGDNTGAVTYTNASAFALAYASHLSHMLGDSVPVGVYVSAIGGSYIENWLPSADISTLQSGGNVNTRASSSDGGLGLFYNGMIHSSAGYTFGAIVFYQGCANSDQENQYKEAFKLYANRYRALYEDANLPIISMQLPQYNEADPWMEFRDMQQNLVEDIDNLYIVCGIDRGDNNTAEGNAYDNIHPCDKWGHAERAAGVYAKILGLTPTNGTPYGVSPLITHAGKNGNDVKLTLSNATSLSKKGSTLNGFEVKVGGSWQSVTAEISGTNIILKNCSTATDFRYLYAEVFADNSYFVYNEYNLPVFPVLTMSISAEAEPPFTGFKTESGKLYYYTNGTGELYTGVYSTDNKYYSQGVLLASGTVIVSDKAYSVTNGVMSLFTGEYSGKEYQNGVAIDGVFKTIDKKVYKYTNGVKALYTGLYNNKCYKDGVVFTGEYEGVKYNKGNPLTGVSDDLYYKDGVLLTSGTVIYKTKCYTVKNGVMSLYTGTYNGKEYNNGVLVSDNTTGDGTTDNKDNTTTTTTEEDEYALWNCNASFDMASFSILSLICIAAAFTVVTIKIKKKD